jgi:hypothetical protein
MLAGGEWHQLVPEGHPGLAEVKWCMNRFIPFLVIDPHPDPQPGSRDAEELSLEVRLYMGWPVYIWDLGCAATPECTADCLNFQLGMVLYDT